MFARIGLTPEPCGVPEKVSWYVHCSIYPARSIFQIRFRVTPEERALIEQKMAQLGTTNMAAYLRKMAIDGFVVNLELPELGELVSLLRRSSNNLNQLTRRAHETGRFYDADLEELRQSHERLWDAAQDILTSLAKIQ